MKVWPSALLNYAFVDVSTKDIRYAPPVKDAPGSSRLSPVADSRRSHYRSGAASCLERDSAPGHAALRNAPCLGLHLQTGAHGACLVTRFLFKAGVELCLAVQASFGLRAVHAESGRSAIGGNVAADCPRGQRLCALKIRPAGARAAAVGLEDLTRGRAQEAGKEVPSALSRGALQTHGIVFLPSTPGSRAQKYHAGRID